MARSGNFIERDVFEEIMEQIPRKDGGNYQDIDTPYGDMSRLVVAWLAATPPDKLQEIYTELGWKGANVRQMHLAAKYWMEHRQK